MFRKVLIAACDGAIGHKLLHILLRNQIACLIMKVCNSRAIYSELEWPSHMQTAYIIVAHLYDLLHNQIAN